MTKSTHVAALTSFTKEKDINGRYPGIPRDFGVVHSMFRADTVRDCKDPLFYEYPGSYGKAICGARVKTVLPTAFQLDDPDACQTCVALAQAQQAAGQTRMHPRPGRESNPSRMVAHWPNNPFG